MQELLTVYSLIVLSFKKKGNTLRYSLGSINILVKSYLVPIPLGGS
jgi:hypothetical protein